MKDITMTWAIYQSCRLGNYFNERGIVFMQLFRRFLCVLLVVFLLMPLSVAAEENNQQVYSDLFLNGTYEEWKKAFTEDPHSFVSALSEEEYGRISTVVTFAFGSKKKKKTATPISKSC